MTAGIPATNRSPARRSSPRSTRTRKTPSMFCAKRSKPCPQPGNAGAVRPWPTPSLPIPDSCRPKPRSAWLRSSANTFRDAAGKGRRSRKTQGSIRKELANPPSGRCRVSLLVVGSVAFDAIQSPYGKVDRIIGGRKIDTLGLERTAGKCFFWSGKYSQHLNERETLVTELNVFADFNPKLPEKFRKSSHVFLANIAPGLQTRVLKQVSRRPKLVALDTMNYWIERTPADLRETLNHVDVLMINDSETRQLSSEHNLLLAARHIFKLGPKTLVVKRGEYGAMMVDKHGVFCVPAFPLEEPHDPTGAGDSFAGGFMGYLAGCSSSRSE